MYTGYGYPLQDVSNITVIGQPLTKASIIVSNMGKIDG